VILEQITMEEFAAGLGKTQTVIVPCGAVEEHGPHLPLATDTIHVYEVCREASRRIPVFVAPPLAYGVVRSTRNHPGTIGIRAATLRTLAADLVADLHRQGLRRFLIISGHASSLQVGALVEVGEELLERYPDIEITVLSILDLAPAAWQEVISGQDDSHAGEVETSVMLHLRPQWVGKERPREWPRFPKHRLVRDKLRYWPGGVWGDAGQASEEKGRKLFALSVEALVSLVRDLDASDRRT
jgi:creatinine amidohydrolase